MQMYAQLKSDLKNNCDPEIYRETVGDYGQESHNKPFRYLFRQQQHCLQFLTSYYRNDVKPLERYRRDQLE